MVQKHHLLIFRLSTGVALTATNSRYHEAISSHHQYHCHLDRSMGTYTEGQHSHPIKRCIIM
jgi:hypothetical protein